MKRLAVSIFMLLGVLGSGSGCGRSDTIYSDNGDQVVVIDDSMLPNGFFDQSMNNADVWSTHDALRLRIHTGSSAAGSFNDATLVGSRSALGIASYESSLLKDFTLHVESTSVTTSDIRVSVLVDLKCDGGVFRSLQSGVPVGSSDVLAAWTVSGAPITDSSGSVVLSTAPSSLTALLNEYPNACLKNGVSDAPDAAPSMQIASVQLSIGAGTSVSAEEVLISSLVLNGVPYSSWSP